MLSHHELFLWETNVRDLRIQRISEMFTFRFYGQGTGCAHVEILGNVSQSPTGPLEILKLKLDAEDLRIHRSSFIH